MICRNNICLVTVTTENYLQWTMTMIFSFLKTNPWYKEDIVVISNDLTEKSISLLASFPRLTVVKPSENLKIRLQLLANELPVFASRSSRFYTLEIFRLIQYDTILFLDSDIVVVKSLEALFCLPGDFHACAEWFSGKGRNMVNFTTAAHGESGPDIIANPVNTGFMLVSKKYLELNLYHALLDFITPVHWAAGSTTLTDQLIINKFFNNKISIIDSRYNYRPKNAEGILRAEHVKIEQAAVIHFLLKAKPWNFGEVWKTSAKNLELLKAYEIWYGWYFDFLTFLHLDQKIKNMKQSGR